MIDEREFPEVTKIVASIMRRADPYRGKCHCGTDLCGYPVIGYKHSDGWDTPAGRYWLYIRCPNCGYEASIWKLGVSRGTRFDAV